MDYFKHSAKLDAVKKAEADGQIADSMEVRTALIERVHRGEITPEQMKAELAAIKRGAKKRGQLTRSQAYARS